MEIALLPAFTDNYIFLAETEEGLTFVVDPGDERPVLQELKARNKSLDYILITHHHWDHVDGIAALKKKFPASQVLGYQHDVGRLPSIDYPLDDRHDFYLGKQRVEVYYTPGHTLGHICYFFPNSGIAFVGDTIFAMGCGRLFEGTPEQMLNSLRLIASWPQDTRLYCAHEYTLKNAGFALTVDPHNRDLLLRFENVKKARNSDQPTVPTTVALETKTNPFLRASAADIQTHLGTSEEGQLSELESFARLRSLKDKY